MKEDYKYGIAFFHADHPDKIIHVVLYEEPPSVHDYFSLGVEFATDEQFNLVERCGNKLTFRDATPREVKILAEKMKKAYTENDE